jgi:hypothetical protein
MYTYICLQQHVYLHLSASTCIPTSFCSNLYTYTGLQPLVYLHLFAETCIPTPVCRNLYTYICLQKIVYIYLSAATCKLTSVYSHLNVTIVDICSHPYADIGLYVSAGIFISCLQSFKYICLQSFK